MYKKGFILTILMLGSLAAMAEHSLGLQIGFAEPIYRLNSPLQSLSRTRLDATPMDGLKVGVVYDASLIKGFGFSMGLNYTFAYHKTKWKDYEYASDGTSAILPFYEYKTEYYYHQGEIFVDWQYKFEIAKKTYIILYTGPTIQCLFDLKATDDHRYTGPAAASGQITDFKPSEESYLRTGKDGHVQRLNVTWGIGAGFQYKRYFLRGGYDFGLINPYGKQAFSDFGYTDETRYDGNRLTRGRLDQWQIKLGVYLWQSDK